ncbi:hypothetical protein LCGC14_0427060 [marine sediment metagenome]|uniref:SF4 helicase domain-containing protein n=1 Tax=marine sediment metagenome TaxID=412755 RepID=A0A0F9SVG8_9ZZZZ
MSNLEGLDNEFYEEKEIRVEDQDIRLLKALVSDDQAARELTSVYDHSLFMGDARPFAEKAIGYFKTYNQLPTKRVMLDQAKSGSFFEEFEHIWDQLEAAKYEPAEFHYDLDKVKDRFARHEVAHLRDKLPDDINDIDLEAALRETRVSLDKAEKVLRGTEQVYTQKTLKEYMPEFRDDFVKKSKDPTIGQGILTGYSYMDYITNGLQPSDFAIVGGQTGSGKSLLLANMAKQMWMQGNTIDQTGNFSKGYNVLYFSLEMPYDQCARRTMASMSDVSTYSLRDCQISDSGQLARLANSANFIKNYPYEFDIVDIPRGVTVGQIEERFLEAVAKGHRPDVVVIDYLGLMDAPGEDGDDWLRLGHIAGKLHEFARTYNIVLLSAVQLNRPKSKDPDDAIGLHRIGRSSNIMHHATLGIQILTRKNEDNFGDLEYHIIKNRNGERGKHNLHKSFKTGSLIDIVDEDGNSYVPQTSDEIGGFSNANVMEDISGKLAELGW